MVKGLFAGLLFLSHRNDILTFRNYACLGAISVGRNWKKRYLDTNMNRFESVLLVTTEFCKHFA